MARSLNFLLTVVACLGPAVPVAAQGRSADLARPNVVLIIRHIRIGMTGGYQQRVRGSGSGSSPNT